MEKSLAETIILEAQLRGERSIAKARFLLMAVLTAFAVYVFVSASSERGLSTELARPVYYIEFLSIALCLSISAIVLKKTSSGVYSAWMRYLPSIVDVSSIAAIHVSMATANNPCYSFCGATVWLYVLFIAVSSLRNSPASVLVTGVYAAFAFITINVFSYADMGNFVPGRNVYSNGAGNLVKLDEYNANRARAGYEPISVGIGMHSGPLMLGTIGENNRMDSTVISDAVNTASRIEELTKKFAKIILLSGDVLACLARPKSVEARFVAEEKVKGKANAVHVFELVGRSDSMA